MVFHPRVNEVHPAVTEEMVGAVSGTAAPEGVALACAVLGLSVVSAVLETADTT
jgi:hypothetical protein